MAMFDFLCVLQLSATLWFVVSLFSSLPPLSRRVAEVTTTLCACGRSASAKRSSTAVSAPPDSETTLAVMSGLSPPADTCAA